jgi:dihydrofolate reductase
MAKLVFGMNQSLDGYVDHLEMRTGPALFRHWIEQVRDLTGSVYGRRMYEVMRYWDEDRPEWTAEHHEFATAWRSQPKWVVSRSLKSVGPNATLVSDDIEEVIRGLKARLVGEIAVSGPDLAQSLTDLGLIDEYRLYFLPVVLGHGIILFRASLTTRVDPCNSPDILYCGLSGQASRAMKWATKAGKETASILNHQAHV